MIANPMQAISYALISIAITWSFLPVAGPEKKAVGYFDIGIASAGTEITDIIQELDSQKFRIREQATNQLVMLGDSAIQPVARHFFDASPEAAWRIKRVLKLIGTESADEQTSLKAIGVLMVLDHKVDGELAGLIETWRINRSQRAILHLVGKGASTTAANQQRQLLMRQPIIRILSANNENQNPLRKPSRSKKPSDAEAKKTIDDLVNGSFADLQKHVFQSLPVTDSSDSLIDGDFAAQAAFRGIGVTPGNMAPTFLEFGKNWKGNSNDLLRMKEVHSLFGIRFDSQTLSPQDMETIAQLPNLRHFGFVNSRFRSSRLSKLVLPTKVNSIELQKQTIDSATIGWMVNLPLTNLTIDNCTIESSARSRFSKLVNITALDFRRITVDESLFDEFQEMTNLEYVFLSVCKFDPHVYRDFAKIRPRVIQFNPVSFLGVQGTRDARQPDSFSCEIEMVVPDSGADKAGVKPGDIITAVNNDEINSFTELRMFISQIDIGEAMELTVMRGEKELTLSATLGENPNMMPR